MESLVPARACAGQILSLLSRSAESDPVSLNRRAADGFHQFLHALAGTEVEGLWPLATDCFDIARHLNRLEIIHVTSPGHGHYSATKAGINGFIRSAALEFSGYGIQ
jgi:NAD(P)-dependent dehydrogenase (short-subunit alcohol dehydrogenase family)